MAIPASSEATEIRRRGRRRLIGVIAIVALLVVFVPMLFDSEQRRPARNDPALVIPPKDNAPALPPPTPAKRAPSTATPVPAAPAPVPDAAKAAPAKEPPPVARVTPETAKVAPKLEGFAVQVGAFRDDAKLRQAREKLAGAGVPHYTERLDTASGELTRLRAGPFATRAAAEAALEKVRGEKLEGQVVPLP